MGDGALPDPTEHPGEPAHSSKDIPGEPGQTSLGNARRFRLRAWLQRFVDRAKANPIIVIIGIFVVVISSYERIRPYLAYVPTPVFDSQLSVLDGRIGEVDGRRAGDARLAHEWLHYHDRNLVWRPRFEELYVRLLRDEELLLRHEIFRLSENAYRITDLQSKRKVDVYLKLKTDADLKEAQDRLRDVQDTIKRVSEEPPLG